MLQFKLCYFCNSITFQIKMKVFYWYFIIILLVVSCTKTKQQSDFKPVNDASLMAKNKPEINAIGVVLNDESASFVKDWVAYQEFDKTISPFYAITQSAALQNAVNLSQKADFLMESVRQPELQQPATLSRFNLLATECKRLADMADIKAITPEEVRQQIRKVLDAYSSVNAKINSLFYIKKMESELQLDPDFQKVLRQNPSSSDTVMVKSASNPKTTKTVQPQENKKSGFEKRKRLLQSQLKMK